MDCFSFRYLLTLVVQFSLATQLLDVVNAYLYGQLEEELFIKPPPDFLPAIPPAPTGILLKSFKSTCGIVRGGHAFI